MAIRYNAPGVYSTEPTNCYGISNRASTSVAGIIGFTEDVRNGVEVGKPVLITNWSQYLYYFGAPNSDGYTDFNAYLPFATHGYFRNGGEACYVTSIGTQLSKTPQPTTNQPTTIEEFYSKIVGDRDEGTGLEGLFEIDEITMVAFPDLMLLYQKGMMELNQVHDVIETMISRCTVTIDEGISISNNRMVVLDSPHDCVLPQQVKYWLEDKLNCRSQFAAMYYPWVKVLNPRDADRPISVPPCGHMMGVWARVDRKEGIHVAPKDIQPKGVIGLNYEVKNYEQELLNSIGINYLRSSPNRNIRIWGARTLAKPENTEYRYINVRRTMNFIEASISQSLEFAIFEQNDERLWSKIRRTIDDFLTKLWEKGALAGQINNQASYDISGLTNFLETSIARSIPSVLKPNNERLWERNIRLIKSLLYELWQENTTDTIDRAFYVICDRTNNPPESVALGVVNVEIGVALVRPGEFIVMSFGERTVVAD